MLTMDTYGHILEGSESEAVSEISTMLSPATQLLPNSAADREDRAKRENLRSNRSDRASALGFPGLFNEGAGCSKNAPARTRTLDPVIKSHLLYQLSYKGGLGAMRLL